ncbi:MAG: Ig-like domain-containing protein, partial [Chloroflexaceae bacterium]|nr:Ig-like domain-containing protein [Chloroflexaceae bacterium]
MPLAAQEEALDVAVTGVSISPANATVATGDSLVLAAAAPVGESVTWSIVSGGGSLSPEGVFTAPAAPGNVTIRASAPSGSAEATVTVQPFAPFDAAPRPVASPSLLAFGPDGRLYLGTSYDSSAQISGLWVTDIRSGGQWQALTQFTPDITDVHDMVFDGDGNLFISTQNGVWRQERGRSGWTKLNGGLPQGQEGFSANGLALINGMVYAGFGNGVVRRFSPATQSWTQVGTGGLPSQELYSLTTDGAGRLFVGTRGAVFRYDNLNNTGATWVKHGNDLPEWVFELQFFGGRLYAGMRTGRISVFNGTSWANSLDRGGQDMLVIGSTLYATGSPFNGTAIMQFTGNGWQALSRDNTHLGGEAWVFTADADGRIYTADRQGRVYRSGPGRLPALPRNTPANLSLAPGDATVRVGTNLNLAATAQFSLPTGNSRLFLPMVQAAATGPDNTAVSDSAGVFWTTSNAAVATVDGRGIVTGVRPGIATITAVSRGNVQVKRTLTITVNDPPRSVSGVQVTAAPASSVAVGDSLFAYATVNGTNLGNQIGVTWSSSDSALAEVTPGGRVIAKAVGQVRITAAAVADASKTGSLDITVTPAPAGGDPNLGNWQNITANLPNNSERAGQSMWINALTFYNGQLFAGAYDDGGIWRRDGETWTQVGSKAEGARAK